MGWELAILSLLSAFFLVDVGWIFLVDVPVVVWTALANRLSKLGLV